MFYTRLINSIVDECLAAALGGYDVEDVLNGIDCGGDIIRETLIRAVCDKRFKSTVRPAHWWEDSAQDKLEEFATIMMETEHLDEESARQLLDHFMSSYYFTMIQTASTPRPRYGKDKGNNGHAGKGDSGEMESDEEEVSGRKTYDIAEAIKAFGSDAREYASDKDGSTGGQGGGRLKGQEYKVEMQFLRSIPPGLARLARLVGRSRPSEGNGSGRFLSAAKSDIAGISVGDNLSSVLPSEIAILSDENIRDIFYRNFAEKRLQVFSSVSKDSGKTSHRDGPVIICLDSSGSMMGRPSEVAAAITIAVSIIAQRHRRKVMVIRYSDFRKVFRLTDISRQRSDLVAFLSGKCGEGNDEDKLFSWLFSEELQQEALISSDILCVSDFGWMPVNYGTMEVIAEYKKKGMKFYGLDVSGEGLRDFRLPEYIKQPGALPTEIIDSMWIWEDGRNICKEEKTE